MAYLPLQWAIGSSSGSVTNLAPQPNADVQPILVGRRGQQGGGQFVNGKDGVTLRWGNGERGTLSHAQFLAFMAFWTTIAKPNAGRVWLRYYNEETNAWVVSRCLMMRPQSRWLGTDGTGPRHADVTLEFRSIGLPS